MLCGDTVLLLLVMTVGNEENFVRNVRNRKQITGERLKKKQISTV